VGGHAHNDQLSFELSLGGTRLVVDPGTYVYTPLPAERNRFRSTVMQNTLAVPGGEPNVPPVGPGALFRLRVDETQEVVAFGEQEFVGVRANRHYQHRRTLQFCAGALHGQDECAAAGRKRLSFHLAPGLEVRESAGAGGVLVAAPDGQAFRFSGGPGTWSACASVYSPAYGVLQRNVLLTLDFTGDRCAWDIERLTEHGPA
jgi:hypothetical protein